MKKELNECYINLLRDKHISATKKKKSEHLNKAESFTKLNHKTIIKKLSQVHKKDRTLSTRGVLVSSMKESLTLDYLRT